MGVAFTKMSKKGQVVIPEEVRASLDFKPTDKFIVYNTRDSVVIKKAGKEKLVKEAEEIFSLIDSKKLKLTPEDIEAEIAEARKWKK